MTVTVPSALITLNSNILTVMDVETSGLIAGYHEILQVALLPLNSDLDPLPGVSPFYQAIKPDYPERATQGAMNVNGLNLDELATAPTKGEVADMLDEWLKELGLPFGKRMTYLTQNAPFDVAFMKCWLGNEMFDGYFTRRGRDTMFLANGINDRAAWRCQPIPFPQVSLEALCNYFKISRSAAHDALGDCIDTAKIYRELLRMEG